MGSSGTPPSYSALWRRAFFGMLFAFVLADAAEAQGLASVTLRAVAPGVLLRSGSHAPWGPENRHPVANGGAIVGQRCVAVIDPGGSAAEGRALKVALRRITALPVCHVINTHGHPDHVLGNAAFEELEKGESLPQFIGHHRLPAALAARGPYYLNALERSGAVKDGTRIIAPTRLVHHTLELDLGQRRLLLRAWPTAHTDNDLTVLDEATGTLWLGDLLFREHLPVVDGSLLGWIGVLDRLSGEPVRLAVPGHGAASSDWPRVLEPQARYLGRLRDDVRAAVRAQQPMEAAVKEVAPPAGGTTWQLVDEFHHRNVTAAYAELEWEE